MMMPSLSTSSSSSSVTTRVDKATSELLVGPDWTMNMEICDICNSNHQLAKDMVKSVKRRLQHKNPKVQLLALTLLETMVKNCGEYIHYHIAERKIVDEMVKIVKKRTDVHVRDKILMLLDSWQEAFGGPSGKYTQYYWACDELRRCGILFPQRSQTAPVITPPVTHPPAITHVGFGMPSNSSTRLDEAMTSEAEGLSSSTLKSMGNVLELLDDMLQAVNPNDRMAVKDEVIVDLVDRCRANQKQLLQMITNTTDEELLVQGIEMNDSLQLVLAKHDAIASGSPLPNNGSTLNAQPSESSNLSLKPNEARDKIPEPDEKSSASAEPVVKDQGEEEEEEDEFAQLARRHSKPQSSPSQSTAVAATEDTASSSCSNALVPVDVPAPEPATTTSTKEQDMIDLLSIVLSTSDETPQAPNSIPAESTLQAPLNSYVAPWAQPQVQPQPQPQYQSMQPQMQPQVQHGYPQYSSAYPPPPWEATSGYSNNQYLASNPYVHPASHGNINGQIPMQGASPSQKINSFQNPQYGNQIYLATQDAVNSSAPMQGTRSLQHVNSFQNPAVNGNFYSTSQATVNPSSNPMQGVYSLQHVNSFPAKTGNGSALNGNAQMNNSSGSIPSGQKTYVPSYRLFEDLNVFGNNEGKLKSGPYPSASGNPSQNMVAGRR